MMALYTMSRGRLDEAADYAREALETFRTARDVSGMVLTGYDFGLLADRLGQRERALRIGGAVDTLGLSTGLGVIGDGFLFLDWTTPEEPHDPAEQKLWDEGAGWSAEQLAAYALDEAMADAGVAAS